MGLYRKISVFLSSSLLGHDYWSLLVLGGEYLGVNGHRDDEHKDHNNVAHVPHVLIGLNGLFPCEDNNKHACIVDHVLRNEISQSSDDGGLSDLGGRHCHLIRPFGNLHDYRPLNES